MILFMVMPIVIGTEDWEVFLGSWYRFKFSESEGGRRLETIATAFHVFIYTVASYADCITMFKA